MSFQSRMGALLRRQEGVRRSRDRFVIIGAVLLLIGAAIGVMQLRSPDTELLYKLISLPIVLAFLWGGWRCMRAAMGLSALYNDPRRLAELESLDELPSLSSTLLPFLGQH